MTQHIAAVLYFHFYFFMALLQIFSFSVFQATGREALILTSEGRNECQKDQLLKDFYTVVKDIISIFKWSDQKIIEESDQKNKLISIISLAPFFDCDSFFFSKKTLIRSSQGKCYQMTNQPLFGGHHVDRPRRVAPSAPQKTELPKKTKMAISKTSTKSHFFGL